MDKPLKVAIGWFLERMVLRPLAAMSRAAQQIAVREVAQVFTAFDAMGQALRTSIPLPTRDLSSVLSCQSFASAAPPSPSYHPINYAEPKR